jgi:AcrR family transcriptional regulator
MTLETRERVLQAAERLVAQHGVDGLSLRQVAASAGQRNNSVVQYHFGTKERLIEEVFAYRIRDIEAMRRETLAGLDEEGREHDVRALLEALILPLARSLRSPGSESHYLRFAARVYQDVGPEPFAREFEENRGMRRCFALLTEALGHLPEPIRTQRLQMVSIHYLNSLAEWERRLQNDPATAGTEIFVNNLVDTCVGLLKAPVTSGTRLVLESAAVVSDQTG